MCVVALVAVQYKFVNVLLDCQIQLTLDIKFARLGMTDKMHVLRKHINIVQAPHLMVRSSEIFP
jgi:hypothetical protein